MHEKYKITTPISHVPVCHPSIFWDNCDCTFNYEADGDGADWSAAYNTAAAHSCLKGIRLTTKTTDQAIGDSVWIWKHLWLPPTYLFQLEFLFCYPESTGASYVYAGARWYNGVHDHAAILRFEQTAGTVSYFAGGLGYTLIPGLAHCKTPKTWNHVRLSAMLHEVTYQYIEVNNVVIDARAIPIPTLVDAQPAHLSIYFAIETTAATKKALDIDHILLMPGNP